ncbi:MAG: 50S ribosomal protein L16 [Candidatus Peribacteria bacterium]|jgi:large subunit ribosomal protein L16|nr:50S ribosomal protein L16 [Candidatus Peribacteria bacterium]
MLLTPKRRKHRKQFRPHLKGVATRGNLVAFGDFGLKATTSGVITNKQLEAARKVIVRHTRKTGQIRMRVFPDTPITKKGLEMPMGSGKSDVDGYATPVRRGKILFEFTGLPRDEAEKVVESASKKLPVKARMVVKGEVR